MNINSTSTSLGDLHQGNFDFFYDLFLIRVRLLKRFLKFHHGRYKDLTFFGIHCESTQYIIIAITALSKSTSIRFIRILNRTFNTPKVLSTVTLADDKCPFKTFWCWGQFCLKGKGLICPMIDGYALSLKIKGLTLNPSILLMECASISFLSELC